MLNLRKGFTASLLMALFWAIPSPNTANATSAVGGSVTGVTPRKVVCRNISTLQRVVIRDDAATWDCEAAGLHVSPGDHIVIQVDGLVAEEPVIEFLHVPPYGSFTNLTGQVFHVDPLSFRVAVFIRVGGGWWTKPFWNAPLTAIHSDGTWTCDITTGGIDQYATTIVAYLVPSGYTPPLMSGGGTLPAELALHAVATVSISRQP